MIKILIALILSMFLFGCAVERAQIAEDAQHNMIGFSKEQVLSCMGPPGNRMAEGKTEVWSYGSGDGRTTAVGYANSNTTATVTGTGNYATGQASSSGSAIAIASRRYCLVNVVMTEGHVSRISYSGPTGGLLTAGEQCAYAIRNCVQQ
jgi:hypothetical protein